MTCAFTGKMSPGVYKVTVLTNFPYLQLAVAYCSNEFRQTGNIFFKTNANFPSIV